MRPIIKSLLLIILVAVPSGISASIWHTVSFDRNCFELVTDTLNGTEYIVPLYKGLSNAAEPGYPELPYKVLSFSVPYNAVDFTVSQVDTDGERISLSRPIRHAQNPEIAGRNYKAEYIGPKTEVYSSNSGFPELTVKYSGEGYDAGVNKYVSVMVSPAIYLPGENTLVFNNTVTFVIDWRTTDDFSGYPVQPVMPRRYSDVEESLQQMAEYVENPASLRKNAVASSRFRVADNNPEYEYIIVTAREFGDAFQRLIAMRRMRGYSSKLFYIEDILADPKYADGDVVSGINDDAGKLRAFLTDAYTNHGTRFVLLGGKPPYMPIRYSIMGNKNNMDNHLVNTHVPTDFYFSDLNNSWDSNHNSIYGESSELKDFSQELCVGRLLCDSTDDITNYINKLYIYEYNPGNGDTSYLTKSVIYICGSMSFHKWRGDSYEHISQAFERLYKNPRIERQRGSLKTNDIFAYGADFINILNEELPGFFDIHGHGHPGGISLLDQTTADPDLNAYGVNALEKDCAYLTDELNNGLDCLNNKFFPSWTYSMSCSVMPFDRFDSENTELNLGESYTLGKDYGGIAFLGNTRDGYIVEGDTIENYFFRALSDTVELGLCYNKGKELSVKKAGTYSFVTHNMLGDPTIRIWLKQPVRSNYSLGADVINFTELSTESQVLITESPIFSDNAASKMRLTAASIERGILLPNNLYSIYGDCILPIILPLEIQNIAISNNNTIVCGNIEAGSDVNKLHSFGDVLFTSNADITIISNGKVRLNQGVKFLKGCKIKIQCDEPVELNGAIFNDGSSVIIKAPGLNMLPDTKIEKGADFKFIPTKNI